MKILDILEIDKNGRALIHSHSNEELVKAITELKKLGCIHHLSANGNFPLSCGECSRFYADGFEEIEK